MTDKSLAQEESENENRRRTWRLRLVKSQLSGEPYEERLTPPSSRISFAPENRCTSGRLNFRVELKKRLFTYNRATGKEGPIDWRNKDLQQTKVKRCPFFISAALSYVLGEFGCSGMTLNEVVNMIVHTYLPELEGHVEPFRKAKERIDSLRLDPRVDRRSHSQFRQLVNRCEIDLSVSGDGAGAENLGNFYLCPAEYQTGEVDTHGWVQRIRTHLGAKDDSDPRLTGGHVVVLLICMAIRDQPECFRPEDSAVRPDDKESAVMILETFLHRLETLTAVANLLADRALSSDEEK